MYVIEPEDVEREAIAQGSNKEDLKVPSSVFLTFNKAVLDELKEIYSFVEWNWVGGKFSPYSSYLAKCWKGNTDDVGVFCPPMGASPIASFCEELIYFGARTIFLLCASWSLGEEYLAKGQIHLPSFALGIDGTTLYYGNKDHRVEAESRAIKALSTALDKNNVDWKLGGVGTCEAFYRITKELVEDYRSRGCLSMENGEVSALYCLAREHNIPVGVLLQPYINLEKGWKIFFMGEKYRETCRLQARVASEALNSL